MSTVSSDFCLERKKERLRILTGMPVSWTCFWNWLRFSLWKNVLGVFCTSGAFQAFQGPTKFARLTRLTRSNQTCKASIPFPPLFFYRLFGIFKSLALESGIFAGSVHGIQWLWQEDNKPSLLRVYKFRILAVLAPPETMVRTMAAKHPKALHSYSWGIWKIYQQPIAQETWL